MSLIIDANRAGDFGFPLGFHAAEILRRIGARQVRIAIGGRLLRELAETPMRKLLVEWQRAGVTTKASDEEVDRQEQILGDTHLLSNDPHVIGLAIVSRARLLYTHDHNLMNDFKNRSLLKPRGKIISPTTPHKNACALLSFHGA